MKHFTIVFFALNLFFAAQSFARESQLAGIGSSEKFSAQYFRIYAKIETLLIQKLQLIDPQHSEERQQAQTLLTDFQSLCNDEDSLDTVSWENIKDPNLVRSAQNVSFACTRDHEINKGGKIFNFVLNTSDPLKIDMLRLSSQEITLTPEVTQQAAKPSRMRIVVVETSALAVGVVGTFLLISKMFPNEQDKVLHGVGSSLFASALTSFLHHQMNFSPNMASITSFIITGALGAAVEIVEPRFRQNGRRGDKDIRDLRADLAGAFVGAITMRWAFNIL